MDLWMELKFKVFHYSESKNYMSIIDIIKTRWKESADFEELRNRNWLGSFKLYF
jgi:hypothetical protein